MRATDWVLLAKANLDKALELYNSDDKGKQHQANRQFETTVKYARKGKKYVLERSRTGKKEEIITKLDEIIAICDQYRTKKGCKRLEKTKKSEE